MPGLIGLDVLANWGAVELLSRASTGSVNDVWSARRGDDEYFVRGSTRGGQALQWELDLLSKAGALGLGVPDVVPALDGRTSVDGVVVFRRVRGERPSSRSDWTLVRDYLLALHDAMADTPQRPGFLSAVDLLAADAGGLVDLGAMPDDAVKRCRGAWSRLEGRTRCVIHGDPAEDNVFIGPSGAVLIDWDEARVDVPLFDLAALPDEVCPLPEDDRWIARQAASAWEAAITWRRDREYAEWRLSQVER